MYGYLPGYGYADFIPCAAHISAMEGPMKKVTMGTGIVLFVLGVLIAGRFPGFYYNETLVGAGYVIGGFGLLLVALGYFKK